ncbi:MAG: alpha/beta hydrolase [Candidatus Pacebacteria bacterium]|nr:alpha/beta hydrolase [Candidatus Paceibacterota bacterium]
MLSFETFGVKKRRQTPVIFLHGWGGDKRSWLPVIERLKTSFYGYAIDLPGFGESPLERISTLHDYAEDIVLFLKAHAIKKAVFVGHSFGGAVSAVIASTYPDYVEKLVLIDASGIRPTRHIIQQVFEGAVGVGKEIFQLPGLKKMFPHVRKLLYSFGPLRSSDYSALNDPIKQKTFVYILREDISDLLVKIVCPTLILWGSEDRDTPLSDGERMHTLIPQSELFVFRGKSHFAYLEDVEVCCAHLRRFLS